MFYWKEKSKKMLSLLVAAATWKQRVQSNRLYAHFLPLLKTEQYKQINYKRAVFIFIHFDFRPIFNYASHDCTRGINH